MPTVNKPNEPDLDIAWHFPASQIGVNLVMEAGIQDDGRSEWRWFRLANGDLILGVWPRGETYEAIETIVGDDFDRSRNDDDLGITKLHQEDAETQGVRLTKVKTHMD